MAGDGHFFGKKMPYGTSRRDIPCPVSAMKKFSLRHSKKSQGLPMNVIILALIVLVVLVVVWLIFTGKIGFFNDKVKGEEGKITQDTGGYKDEFNDLFKGSGSSGSTSLPQPGSSAPIPPVRQTVSPQPNPPP